MKAGHNEGGRDEKKIGRRYDLRDRGKESRRVERCKTMIK